MTSARDQLDRFFYGVPCRTLLIAAFSNVRAGYRWHSRIAVLPLLVVLCVTACSSGPVDRQANIITAETPLETLQDRSSTQAEGTGQARLQAPQDADDAR
jgi:hypothetical protein